MVPWYVSGGSDPMYVLCRSETPTLAISIKQAAVRRAHRTGAAGAGTRLYVWHRWIRAKRKQTAWEIRPHVCVVTDESMRGDMRMRGHESAFGVESRPPVSLRQLAFGVETRPREDDRLRFRGMEVPERRESRQKQAGSGTQSGCVQRLLAWDETRTQQHYKPRPTHR